MNGLSVIVISDTRFEILRDGRTENSFTREEGLWMLDKIQRALMAMPSVRRAGA